MAGERLTSSEKRALLLWLAAGIVGLLFAHKYFFQAFPEASVNFQVSREEALTRAQKFVTGLGENVSRYKSSIIFDVDEDAKVYLERQLGLREANRLMSSELNIWYWEVRFFRPLQEEEFEVRISPSGQIVGYDHKIEEARAGASLDRGSAQSAAQAYLNAKLAMDLRNWDSLPEEANSKKKPNRTDWTFTWEKHGFRAKDAPYRLQVTLQGDRVSGSEEVLKVPEAWQRSFQRLRSTNEFLFEVFFVLYVVVLVVAVWFGIKLWLQGQTRWRGAILLTSLVAALLFLQGLNEWPLWSASYDTKASYATFLAGKVGGTLLFAVLSSLTILVLPAAEPLYRTSWPDRLRLSRTFTLRGLRSKEVFSASAVGLSLAAVHIAYVVGFYVLANWLGAWAPQEVNYEESVNTLFPWISGAAIGLLAATNEEFTFRLFAIPFFQKFTKSRWLAVIVPAFLWSFLHSNYPQEPAYVRGIEIGLIGIVAGLVMLRWGILATLIWHYTVDASLVGLFLLRSNSLYFKVSGVVVAAAAFAPLLFAGVSCLVRGGFEADEDLRNSATPPPDLDLALAQPSGTTAATRRYDALSAKMLVFLAACLLAGALITWRLKPESIGDYLKLSVNAKTARAKADQILRTHGVDPSSYKCAVIFANVVDFDPVANEFLRERVGIARVNEIYNTQVPGALWQARYFRDSQPEEYTVKLKPDGSLFALQHKIAEDSPGASLKKEEAVGRAEKYLRNEKKIDLSQWTLVDSDSETRPHRVDHLLTWQLNSPIDTNASACASGHACICVRVAVLGDEVTDYRRSYFRRSGSADEDEPASEGFSTFIRIPDDWRRKQEETTLPRETLTFGPIVLLGGLGLTAVILFLMNLRSEAARAIPWKRLSLWAAWGLAGFYLVFALGGGIPNFLNAYNTAISFKTTVGVFAIFALLGGPFSFGFLVLLFGIGWYYAKVAFGDETLPGWRGMPGKYYRDALWIGLGGSAGLLGLERLLDVASTHWPTVHRYLDISFGQDFDAVFPAASILGGTLLGSLRMTAYTAVIACFVAARIKQVWLRLLLFFVGVFAFVGLFGRGWGGPADFAKQSLAQLILLGVIVLGVRFVMRFNVLGCFLVVAGISFVGRAAELLAQPDAFYHANGYAVLLMLALLFAWPLAAWRFNSMNPAGPSAASTGNS